MTTRDHPDEAGEPDARTAQDERDDPTNRDGASKRPLLPDADAGRTDAGDYSTEEKVHKGEDELP
jgi:hypothetical protein